MVRPETDAIECDAEDIATKAVLGEDACDVSVVVLHAHLAGAGVPPVFCKLRRCVVGMQVGGDGRGSRPEEPQVGPQRLVVVIQRAQAVKVTDVWTRERVALVEDTERVLEVGTERQHAVVGCVDADRERAVPARTADHPYSPVDDPDHGVVVSRIDLAIVKEKAVCDGTEPQHGLVVVLGDRLFAHVAAGHDERRRYGAHEQVVHRRVRQHHAQLLQPGRHGVGHAPRL